MALLHSHKRACLKLARTGLIYQIKRCCRQYLKFVVRNISITRAVLLGNTIGSDRFVDIKRSDRKRRMAANIDFLRAYLLRRNDTVFCPKRFLYDRKNIKSVEAMANVSVS